MASEFENLEIRGVRHAVRTQVLARALHEPSAPAHPDFDTSDSCPGPGPGSALDASGASLTSGAPLPAVPPIPPSEDRDAHIEFALMRHVVDRMRAAFFHEPA